MTIVEGEQIITEDKEIAETMGNFYKTAVDNIGINKITGYEQSIDGIDDPIEAAVQKFANHPSILKINEVMKDKGIEPFNFSKIDREVMEKEIQKLN